MKKILISLLCVLLCTTCLLACGKKEKEEETIPNDEAIYGTWTESIWDSGYTFREDGSGLDIFWDQPFIYTAIDGDLVITYTEGIYQDKQFTYSVEENTLTLTRNTEGEIESFTYTRS
ncbi:MAG: hypothetical protein J6S31_05975 [Lachnospiraceae bacterium]|nr:hypothetical protein [Lachnospiraceae bacterium]